jgi:hypothetical protein
MASELAPPPLPVTDSPSSDPLALSHLVRMLPASCADMCDQLDAAECSEHGALAVYGQWTSCSTFSSMLQQCIADPALLEQLVSAAQSSNETSCLQLLLMLASTSVSSNMECTSAWLDAGLFHALMRAFAPEQATATRKLAFDLAFVIVHARLRFETVFHADFASAFGFEELVRAAGGAGCARAAREYQVASLFAVRACEGHCFSRVVLILPLRFCCPP